MPKGLVFRDYKEHDEDALRSLRAVGRVQLQEVGAAFWSIEADDFEELVDQIAEELDDTAMDFYHVYDHADPSEPLYDVWIAQSETGAVFYHGTTEDVGVVMSHGDFEPSGTGGDNAKELAVALQRAVRTA